MPSQVLSMREAAKRLAVARPTLYVLINNGTLRTFKIGRHRKTLDSWIDDCIALLEAETVPLGLRWKSNPGGKPRGRTPRKSSEIDKSAEAA